MLAIAEETMEAKCRYRFVHSVQPFIVLQLIISFFLFGCSSNSILDSKVSITPEEQRRLISATNRQFNNELYRSDLSDVIHPSEKELFNEADLITSEQFENNYKILVKWYENKLSKSELRHLANNCSILVGRFADSFPLTEKSLPCAGWWLERRAKVILSQNPNVKEMTKSRKNSIPTKILSGKNILNLHAYKSLTFSDASYNVDRLSLGQFDKLVKQMISGKRSCQYKNTYAASIFRLDAFGTQEHAYKNAEKIYKQSAICYAVSDSFWERLNLRMGVLRMMHGNYQLAMQVLKKNQGLTEPQDNSRTLFWLGIAAQKINPKKKPDNQYWDQMIRENPLGFFSIIANEKLKQDPLDKFVPDQSILIQNRVSGDWNENNLQTFLADLFYKKHNHHALKRFSRTVANNYWMIDKDLFLYWANINNLMDNDRATILMMSKYFESQKEPKVSARLLELNFPTRYSNEILQTSEKIDPLLVLALIRQESAFDSMAISGADARGLMQILPSTARTLQRGIKAEKLYEPDVNIKLGVMYLEKLFQKYKGRTEYVLAAYNAGPMRVDTWSQRVPDKTPLFFIEYVPFRETRNYVSTIMRNYYWYKRLMHDKKNDKLAKLYVEKNVVSIWKPDNLVTTLD